MSARLEPINLTDFSGGLNLRYTDFQVAPNESPGMLNMEMDPRGGFATRPGWTHWNDANIIAAPTDANWRPRNAEQHLYSTGAFAVFITNANKVWAGTPGTAFVDLAVTAQAAPHLADFAGWGDKVYMALGRGRQVARLTGVPSGGNLPSLLTAAAAATWNDNYTTPEFGVAPQAEHMEAHGGYMFVANTIEDGVTHPSRLRWSHPDEPEDWASADYIDIEQGGSQITAIRSFGDHLVIFKADSTWALYGYDRDSWQLVKVSQSIGTPAPSCVTRSENAIYFYSASARNGIYAYTGQAPVLLSEAIKRVMDSMTGGPDVWLGWVGKRLWCSLPYDPVPSKGSHGSIFVFDPELGNGAWTWHKPARGTIACIVERSDVLTEYPLIVTCGCTGFAGAMKVGSAPLAAGDVFTAAEGLVAFECFYRTSWQHAGWPERQKSWLRPRIIARVPAAAVAVRMDTFWNYEGNSARRSHVFDLPAAGGAFWRELGAAAPQGDGFDWGDGTLWGGSTRIADTIVRPHPPSAAARGSLGWARAIQLEFKPENPLLALAWAVDAIVLKFNIRRFTT